MADSLADILNSLAGHPWAIITAIFILTIGFAVKLAFSNPKFWDLMQAHLSVNTALTKETNENVKTIMDRQSLITKIQATQQTELDAIQQDLKFLLRSYEPLIREVQVIEATVSRLQQKACLRSPECPNRLTMDNNELQ